MTEIGYEEDDYTFTGGYAGEEANWEYSPPGEDAPAEEWEWAPDEMGEWQSWEPGAKAPTGLGEFFGGMGAPPSDAQQTDALTGYIEGALGGGEEEAPPIGAVDMPDPDSGTGLLSD